jgi:hypothetical protein
MKVSSNLFLVYSLISTVVAKGGFTLTCPLKCPSCTKCDPFKGTCILPRDFVSCTSNGVNGVCYGGTCTTGLVLTPPLTTSLGKCQTYKCKNNICNLSTYPDGFDCTTPGQALPPSVCVKGVCSKVIIAITDVFPKRNIGCIGLPDGTACDTNDVLGDGETCVKGVCQFPDGTYYGFLP